MAATFTIPATTLLPGTHTFTIDTPAGATGCFVTFTNAGWTPGTSLAIEIDVSFDGVTFVTGMTSTFTDSDRNAAGGNTLSASFGISGAPAQMRFALTNNQSLIATGNGGWI